MAECDLLDLGFSGAHFTWSNQREGFELICERLDRCIANTEWCNLFLRNYVSHGSIVYSYHIPIVLHIDRVDHTWIRGTKPFQFEFMCLGNTKCKEIINES